jgi:hypothetical protein
MWWGMWWGMCRGMCKGMCRAVWKDWGKALWGGGRVWSLPCEPGGGSFGSQARPLDQVILLAWLPQQFFV